MSITSGNTIPYVSVNAGYIASYHRSEVSPRTRRQKANQINLKCNLPQGVISRKANKRVSRAIDWLLYLANEKEFYHQKFKRTYKFKVNFVTLTLSSTQNHTDNEIKSRLLNQFITEIRAQHRDIRYLWRAEAQHNGNIHFHLVTDKFLPWNELRNQWNRVQDKLGYVQAFNVKFRGRTPNSTDVHSVRNVRNLSAYLANYCGSNTKGAMFTPCVWKEGKLVASDNPREWRLEDTPYYEYNRKGKKVKRHSVRITFGKLWGMSQNLSCMKAAGDMLFNELEAELWKIKKAFRNKWKKVDYGSILYVKVEDWMKLGCEWLEALFTTYVSVLGQPSVGLANKSPSG